MTREEEAEAVLNALREPRSRGASQSAPCYYGKGYYIIVLSCGHRIKFHFPNLDRDLLWPSKFDCTFCD